MVYILVQNRRSQKFYDYFLLPIFFIVGDLPYFLFELRHQFYNLQTAIFVLTHLHPSREFSPHYLIFPLIVFFIFFINYLYIHVSNFYWKLLILTPFLILGFTLFSTLDRSPIPLGHPPGWTYPLEVQVVNTILQSGCPQNYNIAATIGGDTRSSDLRCLLTIKQCPPLPVENYPHAQTIYLLAPPSRPPAGETVWEISSFRPFTVKSMVKLNDLVILYRLDKSNAKTVKNN